MLVSSRIRTGPQQKEMRRSVSLCIEGSACDRLRFYIIILHYASHVVRPSLCLNQRDRSLLNHISDVDECVETRGICENGRCINTEGGVICECPIGYRLSDRPNSMTCIDVRQDECYDNYRHGQCTIPREDKMSKKHCCCTMGKAWGRYCEQCPPENSGESF